jgi:glycosyltransferase involved in cell wall biosynthesis
VKIAVNAGTLRGFGSGLVGRAILRELEASPAVDEACAWVPAEWDERTARGNSGKVRRVAVQAGFATKFRTENWEVRRVLRQEKVDCLFSLGDTSLPFCPVPHLLLVQMPYLAYGPEERDFHVPVPFRLKIRAIETYFRLAIPSVSMFTVQSRHMKDRLSRRWRIDPSRIAIVPSAIEEMEVAAPVGGQYLFYPASASAHKNHVVLAETMFHLKRQGMPLPCRLSVLEAEVPELVTRARVLGVMDQFEFLGALSLGRSRELMAGATVVVLPAKLETFGLPYYEAMSVGAPVVASDRDCAREACGDAARYALPDSGKEFAEKIARLVTYPLERSALGAAGRARYQQVRQEWTDVVSRYVGLLRTISGEGGSS